MKTIKKFFLFSLTIAAFASCSDKNDVIDQVEAITTDEALDIVAESVAIDEGGISLEFLAFTDESATVSTDVTSDLNGSVTSDMNPNCGQTKTRTFSKSYSGPNVSWSVAYEWMRTLQCNEEGKPTHFDVKWSADKSFENQRYEAVSVANGEWTVTFDNDGNFRLKVFNGDYMKHVSRQSKISDRGHIADLDINIVDVVVRRVDKFILSGTLYFTLTGENNTGNTFAKSGQVVFNGDCTATITIDGGGSRTVSICD